MIRSRTHHQGLTLLYDWRRQLQALATTDMRVRALKDVEDRIFRIEDDFRIVGWTPQQEILQ